MVKIGAKVVVDARYVPFQIAEVAIKSDLFADVFRMIAALQQNLIQRLREASGCRAFEPD
jgi:hypothetical protein